jgi:hypothetical protein
MKLKCRCGNIEVEWNTMISPLVARKCGCEYCISQDCAYVRDADSVVSYIIRDNSQHRIVKHGSSTASFHECANCGLVLVTSEIENGLYTVLNAKVLGIKSYSIDPKIKNYSGESIAERLLRRKNNWCKVRVCT